jgi:hypothetical protein
MRASCIIMFNFARQNQWLEKDEEGFFAALRMTAKGKSRKADPSTPIANGAIGLGMTGR